MGTTAVSLFSHLSQGMDVPKVLAAIGVDDYRRFQRGRLRIIPEKEFLSVSLERDFDEMGHSIQSIARV
jgi:hypothetical protein